MKKPFIALAFLSLLAGCSSEPTFHNQASMDDIYDQVHATAQRETVSLLRQGLRARPELGSSEPYLSLIHI